MTIKINGTNTTAQPSITGTDTDTGLVYGTDEVKIVTGGTERVKIDTNGLKFNGDTAAANALDDYEEGTWTPSINVGTATISSSHYIKIGSIVHLSSVFQNFSNTTSTTPIRITDLPFPRKASTQGVAATFYRSIDIGTQTQLVALMGTAQITFYGMNPGNSATYMELDYQHLTSTTNSQLRFSMIYVTD